MYPLNPPFLDVRHGMPIPWLNVMEPKPSLQRAPNFSTEAALEKKMRGQLLPLGYKAYNGHNFSILFSKPISRPYSILNSQPSKSLALWRGAWFPNQRRHRRSVVPQELHIVVQF
jgi:hypothetical protein